MCAWFHQHLACVDTSSHASQYQPAHTASAFKIKAPWELLVNGPFGCHEISLKERIFNIMIILRRRLALWSGIRSQYQETIRLRHSGTDKWLLVSLCDT